MYILFLQNTYKFYRHTDIKRFRFAIVNRTKYIYRKKKKHLFHLNVLVCECYPDREEEVYNDDDIGT